MDDEIELICQLTARAGMIMEDVSPLAITMLGKTGLARTHTLISLAQATHAISALIAAALALDQRLGR